MNNSGDIAWMLTSSALVLLMTPALAFFYGGLVKRKNVLNTMVSSAFMMGLGSMLWIMIGFTLSFSGKGLFIGDLHWFGMQFVEGVDANVLAPTTATFAIYQMMFAIITPALISGAVAERIRFSTLFIFCGAWSIIVYYPLVHMFWGGGWLQQLGAIDFAGGNVVHVSAGVSALLLALLLGKRKMHGKTSYRPHNVPFVFLGAGLLWFGWFGFNAGSAGAANSLAVHAFLTTNTSAAAAMLSWMLIEKFTVGKVSLIGVSTGLVVGLATITGGAGYVPVWAAVIIGLVASPICYFSITTIKKKFGYDDTLDAFGCHGIGGIIGVLATGLFAMKGFNPDPALDAVKWNGLVFGETELFVRQLLSLGATIAIAAAGTLAAYGIARLATRRVRVTSKEEDIGLDIAEHDESAYPAFNGMD